MIGFPLKLAMSASAWKGVVCGCGNVRLAQRRDVGEEVQRAREVVERERNIKQLNRGRGLASLWLKVPGMRSMRGHVGGDAKVALQTPARRAP